jgi:hypothetical protein
VLFSFFLGVSRASRTGLKTGHYAELGLARSWEVHVSGFAWIRRARRAVGHYRGQLKLRLPLVYYENMARLIETKEWAKLVESVASGGYVDFGPVFQIRRDEDIADLAAILAGKPCVARDSALQLLFALCMQNDPHVRPENFRRLCPALKEYVVEGYPEKKLGQSAWTFWRKIDPAESGEYLREWVKQNGISESNATRVTIDLTFGNEESIALLRRYAERNPGIELAKPAELALARSASDWNKKLQESGRQWREKRNYGLLVDLTNELVDRPFSLREDVFVSTILKVIGEPDAFGELSPTGDKSSYTYFSKDKGKQTGYLYLEADKQGKVTAWRLDNIS